MDRPTIKHQDVDDSDFENEYESDKECQTKKIDGRKFINRGKKNPMWKGDDVGIKALHGWVRARKPKPGLCECCKKVPPYDLANISQEYKRDINDFEWICRKCHMGKDGRVKNLYQYTHPPRYQGGETNVSAKLTDKKVRIIKHALSFGIRGTVKQLEKMMGVNKGAILNANSGKTWSHIIIEDKSRECFCCGGEYPNGCICYAKDKRPIWITI